MKIIIYYFLLFEIFIYILNCYVNSNKIDDDLNYTIDITDENDEMSRHQLIFNNSTKLLNNYEDYTDLSIKVGIICRTEDIDKSEEDKTTLLIWIPDYSINIMINFFNVFPVWETEQRNKSGKNYCMKIKNVGWVDNANKEICKPGYYEDNTPIECPDSIVLGTTQFSYRYNKDETFNLHNYFRDYFKKTGNSIESMMNKYSMYDYHLGNNWLAVPLIVDFRTLRFNTTTIDFCKSQGYDIHYPPPFEEEYWGSDYIQTWNWEKLFEYAKMINECIDKPSFSLPKINSYEDTKFFITVCQSMKIPFITEDVENDVKKCGFREYADKFTFIKDAFENQYIEPWLEEKDVWQWKNSTYPSSMETQPLFRNYNANANETFNIYGFKYSSVQEKTSPDIKLAYMPGLSTFLGGSGIIITKDSNYKDELFEFIEILINKDYPYISLLNPSVTPFENIRGMDCQDEEKQNKKDLCNSLLQSNETIPYYFSYKNNDINIIYLTHISIGSDRGISINTKNSLNSGIFNDLFTDTIYRCDEKASFENKTITYDSEYKIELKINEKDSIILKSMIDISTQQEQSINDICTIFDETIKIAKPYQFPYNTFGEINVFEYRAPISILLAHFYYKHNNTNEGSLEDVINECCDIIDDSFLPSCVDNNKIKFELSECNESTLKQTINFLNCKIDAEFIKRNITTEISCKYIPYKNFKGIIIEIYILLALLVEVVSLIIIIIKRHERCVYTGINFLIGIILSSMLLDISVMFWIGKQERYKCIIKFWTLICGMTGFISSYSIKAEIITLVYNNRRLTKTNNKYRSYFVYICIGLLEIFLLCLWTLIGDKIEKRVAHIEQIGYYEYDNCSLGKEGLLSMIFVIDFALLSLPIITSYFGRNIPTEYNESKKIFITSLLTFFLLASSYLSYIIKNESIYINYFIAIIIITITLITNIVFIGQVFLVLFNISIEDRASVLVVVSNSKETELAKFSSDHN